MLHRRRFPRTTLLIHWLGFNLWVISVPSYYDKCWTPSMPSPSTIRSIYLSEFTMSSRNLTLYLRLWKTVSNPKDRAGGEGYVICWSQANTRTRTQARGNTHSLTAYTQVNPVVRFGTAPKSCGPLPSGSVRCGLCGRSRVSGFRVCSAPREAAWGGLCQVVDFENAYEHEDAFLRTLRVLGSWLQAPS